VVVFFFAGFDEFSDYSGPYIFVAHHTCSVICNSSINMLFFWDSFPTFCNVISNNKQHNKTKDTNNNPNTLTNEKHKKKLQHKQQQ